MVLCCHAGRSRSSSSPSRSCNGLILLPVLTLLLLLPAKQLGLHCIDAIPIASRAPGPEPDPLRPRCLVWPRPPLATTPALATKAVAGINYVRSPTAKAAKTKHRTGIRRTRCQQGPSIMRSRGSPAATLAAYSGRTLAA